MRFFENCYFEYKEDKVAMQMLNLNTKTTFHSLLQTISAEFVLKTAAKQNNIHGNKKPKLFADELPLAKETFLESCHRDFALID